MNQSPSRDGPQNPADAPPEPTFAERARTLMHVSRVGTLCTSSQKHPQWPFGSVVAYGLDEQGNPSLLISDMAMHTKNLLADPRVSVIVMPQGQSGDPLGAARVTVMGQMRKVPKEESGHLRYPYLARHENAAFWVDFADFNFYVMDTLDIYYVGGFGAMGWVTASDYHAARVDPLADAEADLIEDINANHADALLQMGKRWGNPDTQQASLTSVDRLGLQLRLKTSEGLTGTRIGFPSSHESPDDVRTSLARLARKAADTGN